MDFECKFSISLINLACENIASQPERFLAYIVASSFTGFLFLAVTPIRTWLWGVIVRVWGLFTRNFRAANSLAKAKQAITNGKVGPWLAFKPITPADYMLRMERAEKSFPVILSCNLKGGVGKTTITANIAASFAQFKNAQNAKPVLAIDLDYQGSLSSLMFAGSKWRTKGSELSAASHSVLGRCNHDWLAIRAQPATWVENPGSQQQTLRQIAGLSGIEAFYDLADVEDRLRILWVISEEKRDIRYFLYELIHNDALRNKFSMIFIDAPPRMTTACIQALVASTHVLIPTILDELSAEAVAYFGRQLARHEVLWPNLQVLGILGSMVAANQNHQRSALETAGDRLRESLRVTSGKLAALERSGTPFEFPFELSVPDRASLGRTIEKGIAYEALANGRERTELRGIFDDVAAEIRRRMN